MARPEHCARQTGKPDHLPHLLSQACEVDIAEGIRWHFLDVPAGVPFLPQEDGRFGSIFQVLFPEVAALAHDPPETHTTNFAETKLNPDGKAQPGHLPQPSVHEEHHRHWHLPPSSELVQKQRHCLGENLAKKLVFPPLEV